jgi:transposase
MLRSGSPWADVPERYGLPTTIYNRFNRWHKAGSGTGFRQSEASRPNTQDLGQKLAISSLA